MYNCQGQLVEKSIIPPMVALAWFSRIFCFFLVLLPRRCQGWPAGAEFASVSDNEPGANPDLVLLRLHLQSDRYFLAQLRFNPNKHDKTKVISCSTLYLHLLAVVQLSTEVFGSKLRLPLNPISVGPFLRSYCSDQTNEHHCSPPFTFFAPP